MATSDDSDRYLNITLSSSSPSSSMFENSYSNNPFDPQPRSIEVLPPPPRDEVMKWFDEPFKFEIEEVQLVKDEEDNSEKVMFDPENLVL
jgi:hypothetical protein